MAEEITQADVVDTTELTDIEKAKKLLDDEKITRMQNCQSEIQAILQKYNCDIVSITQIRAN